MNLKYLLTLMAIFILGIFNNAKAEVWLPITAENGKVSELELDTIDINGNIATYSLKRNDKDYTYIAKMKINLEDKTFAVISNAAYSNGKQISFENNSNKMVYNSIKNGTLADSVYNILIVAKESPALDVKKKVWEKYFKKQQKHIQRNWHPNFDTYSLISIPNRSIAYMTLIIDKNGNIISKQYQCNPSQYKYLYAGQYDKFNEWLEAKITNIFVQYSKFDPLPKEYQGKNIIVVLKFEYSRNHDARTSGISWEETGIGYLENGKNYCGWITFGKVMYAIAAFPIAIPASLFFDKNVYAWF